MTLWRGEPVTVEAPETTEMTAAATASDLIVRFQLLARLRREAYHELKKPDRSRRSHSVKVEPFTPVCGSVLDLSEWTIKNWFAGTNSRRNRRECASPHRLGRHDRVRPQGRFGDLRQSKPFPALMPEVIYGHRPALKGVNGAYLRRCGSFPGGIG